MRVSTIVIALVVISSGLAVLPEMAAGMDMVACSELQFAFDPMAAGASPEHPRELQTVFLVTENMSPGQFRLNYNLTRQSPTIEVEELHSTGKLIGQVTVLRNGKTLFRSEVKRDRMTAEVNPWTYRWTKEASLTWSKKMDLVPGDVVIFSARFNNTPKMGAWDRATLSGEIPF